MVVGYDNINIPEATSHSIVVGYTPGVTTFVQHGGVEALTRPQDSVTKMW